MNKKSLRALIDTARAAGRVALTAPEAQHCAMPTAFPRLSRRLAKSAAEAVKFAARLRYPVVLKIVSDDILHKTEAGGVVVGINNSTEVRRAFERLVKSAKAYNKSANIQGVLVQQMVPGGQEVMVGAVTDPSFGKMVAFGLGGVLVEVMKDITFRLAPVSKKDALSMLDSVAAAEVLRGVRGAKGVNRAALADIIVKASKLVSDFPEILEVDLNPIFATEKGARAVDVRIVLGERSKPRERFGQSEILAAMQRIMNPRAVAVIGASAEDGKIGNSVMKNLINGGYRGAIYPIHPKASRDFGAQSLSERARRCRGNRRRGVRDSGEILRRGDGRSGTEENSRRGDDSLRLRRSRRASVAGRIARRRAQARCAHHGAEHLWLLLHAAKSLRDVLHALRRQRQSRAQLAVRRRRHVDHRLLAHDAHGRVGHRRSREQIRSRRGRSADLLRAGRQYPSHRDALRRLKRRPFLCRSGEPGFEKETDRHAQSRAHGARRARRRFAHRRARRQRQDLRRRAAPVRRDSREKV